MSLKCGFRPVVRSLASSGSGGGLRVYFLMGREVL